MSGQTVARRRAALRQFYRFLIDEEEVKSDPTRNLPTPKQWKTVPKALSQADLEAMVSSLGKSWFGIRDKAMLLTFFASGLRESELAALKVQDLDLDAGIAKVWAGKGNKDGIVPLSPSAIAALKEYLPKLAVNGTDDPSEFLKRRKAAGLRQEKMAKRAGVSVYMVGGAEIGRIKFQGKLQAALWEALTSLELDREREGPRATFVFPGRGGKQLTRMAIWFRIRDIAQTALGKRVSPHFLRHGFATALVEGGADIHDVQALMRHS